MLDPNIDKSDLVKKLLDYYNEFKRLNSLICNNLYWLAESFEYDEKELNKEFIDSIVSLYYDNGKRYQDFIKNITDEINFLRKYEFDAIRRSVQNASYLEIKNKAWIKYQEYCKEFGEPKEHNEQSDLYQKFLKELGCNIGYEE